MVPALRERERTIELAEHFLTTACRHNGRPLKTLTEAAGRAHGVRLSGNVRELRNIIERLVILTHAEAETLTEADIRERFLWLRRPVVVSTSRVNVAQHASRCRTRFHSPLSRS